MKTVHVIDSHTEGEPTRVVVTGGPDLGRGPIPDQVDRFRKEQDAFRRAIVSEPRGSEVLVGALLLPPTNTACVAGVIFFNNVGYLGMCGHGAIGVIATLAYQNRIKPAVHQLETPVGTVSATLHSDGRVSIRNVPAYRFAKGVKIGVSDFGTVQGDIAWGGNWFFLVDQHQEVLRIQNVGRLSEVAWKIRRALSTGGITGANGAEIDHIELFGPAKDSENQSRNFVLCPGGAYDRSPCGTGTSAKLACLVEDGKLKPGEIWRQESIVGSVFEGSVNIVQDQIIPTITGRAWITAETDLVLNSSDPFCWGIDPSS